MIKWLMEPFEDKLSKVETTLGDIHEVTEYILGRMKEKTLS